MRRFKSPRSTQPKTLEITPAKVDNALVAMNGFMIPRDMILTALLAVIMFFYGYYWGDQNAKAEMKQKGNPK